MADEPQVEVSLKPLLAVAVQEAVKLALIDSAIPPRKAPDGQYGFWTDEEIEEFKRNIYAIPSESIAAMDPGALARNVAVRLLGSGGWHLPAGYTGNMTPREVFEGSIQRPDQDVIAEAAFD